LPLKLAERPALAGKPCAGRTPVPLPAWSGSGSPGCGSRMALHNQNYWGYYLVRRTGSRGPCAREHVCRRRDVTITAITSCRAETRAHDFCTGHRKEAPACSHLHENWTNDRSWCKARWLWCQPRGPPAPSLWQWRWGSGRKHTFSNRLRTAKSTASSPPIGGELAVALTGRRHVTGAGGRGVADD
jgi:hypothetical protein